MIDKIDRQPAIHRRWIKEGKLTEEESEKIIMEHEYEAEQGEQAKSDSLENAQRVN